LRTINSPNDVKQNNRYKTDQTREQREFDYNKLQLRSDLKSYVKEPEREKVPKISMSVKD